MVSIRLGVTAAGSRRALCAAALIACGCGRGGSDAAVSDDTTATGIAAGVVRARYRAPDVAAAGAWTWAAGDGTIYVLIDAQSLIEGLVQARAELWATFDTTAALIGRSDVMPSAAEFGAFSFEDMTADGLPDLFGYVADSAGTSYPVFIPGARGGMVDELAVPATGWRFSAVDPEMPQVLAGPTGACALQLWAEDPAPDGLPAGWRYLSIRRDGGLSAPMSQAPVCGP